MQRITTVAFTGLFLTIGFGLIRSCQQSVYDAAAAGSRPHRDATQGSLVHLRFWGVVFLLAIFFGAYLLWRKRWLWAGMCFALLLPIAYFGLRTFMFVVEWASVV